MIPYHPKPNPSPFVPIVALQSAGGAQKAACAVKLAFGLLTGFPSASGFVLLLQISIFALPVIQGLPGDPLVAFTWSLVVAYLHAVSLFQRGVHHIQLLLA
jgi:hypothetical protein